MLRYIDENDPSRGMYEEDEQDYGGNYAPPTQAPQVGSEGGGGTSYPRSTSVGSGGDDFVPGYAVQATTPPATYDAPPPPENVRKLIADFIQSHGLTANQFDPSSLSAIVEYLRSKGISAQVDVTDANGHTGGIRLNGAPYQLIDGSNRWTTLQPWESGSAAASRMDDWFAQNAPPAEAYTTPERPDYLKGEYKPPVWSGGDFVAPDANTLAQDPGYQARLAASQKGFERSAAAKGTILSGGSQVALGREQQNIASSEYANAFGRAYDTYRQKYGQFQDSLTASGAARGLNENAFQSDVANGLNQYGTRYRTYRDAVDDQFRLSDLGLRSTQAGAPA